MTNAQIVKAVKLDARGWKVDKSLCLTIVPTVNPRNLMTVVGKVFEVWDGEELLKTYPLTADGLAKSLNHMAQ